MSMIQQIDAGIDYALKNPGKESHRLLLCYAALDVGLGHVLRDRRQDTAWYVDDAPKAVDALIPSSGTCGLLDTTTILNGYRLLHPELPVTDLPPGAIFDLATFISVCLFEDNVLFLDNSEVSASDIAKLLDGLPVYSLPWEGNTDFALIVENTWGEAERYAPPLFNDPERSQLFVEHWSKLAGEQLDLSVASWPSNYRHYFSSIDSIAVKNAIVRSDPGDNYLAPNSGLLEEFITESSIRAVFYSFISNIIGVTYYASSFRTRLREMVYEHTERTVVTDTMALFNRLNETFHRDIAKDDLIVPEVEMPFALSAALAGVKSCSELCENIMDLRKITRPLREKRAELALAWRNQDQPSVNALVKAITDDARLLANNAFFAGRGIVSKLILSSGGARPALGALGKLLLSFSGLPDDVQEVLRQRCVRPELWVVSRLSAQARRTLNCIPPLLDLLKPKGLTLSSDLSARKAQRHLNALKRLAA